VRVRRQPGHTNGCPHCILETTALALWRRLLVAGLRPACDFQQGDAHTLYRSITEQLLLVCGVLLALSRRTTYTGRGVTFVAEAKASTPASVARPTNAICVYMDV